MTNKRSPLIKVVLEFLDDFEEAFAARDIDRGMKIVLKFARYNAQQAWFFMSENGIQEELACELADFDDFWAEFSGNKLLNESVDE